MYELDCLRVNTALHFAYVNYLIIFDLLLRKIYVW